MPCRDYSDDVRAVDNTETYKILRDKLARIACRALTKIEEAGLPIDDAETAEWWTQHKIDDAAERRREARIAKERMLKLRRDREAKRVAEINQLKKLQSKYGKDV